VFALQTNGLREVGLISSRAISPECSARSIQGIYDFNQRTIDRPQKRIDDKNVKVILDKPSYK
jgi:hypothetical protein